MKPSVTCWLSTVTSLTGPECGRRMQLLLYDLFSSASEALNTERAWATRMVWCWEVRCQAAGLHDGPGAL